MTEITQADRDAAELTLQDRLKQIFDDAGGSDTLTDLLREFDFEGSRELADAIVWAIADSNRHRMEERAAIVAWLAERLKDYLDECPDRWPIIDDICDLLTAAEAGEHLR